jgi:deoxyribodipyrimidine photo-lyase
METNINPNRVLLLQEGEGRMGPVVYWMQRDQRINDNWGIIYAQQTALNSGSPLVIVFSLVPEFLDATIRQYGFLIKGLNECRKNASIYNIPFFVLLGDPSERIPEFIEDLDASVLITDFNPVKIARYWKRDVAAKIKIPFYQVDAHNIVPCWIASNKQEFAAYTLRPKLHKLLPEYLEEFPKLKKMKSFGIKPQFPDREEFRSTLKINFDVPEIDWLLPGESAAHNRLKTFLDEKLDNYSVDRNDPNKRGLSNISPYLHFGHIAPQRVALEVSSANVTEESKKAYLEELIVRRELSDNFCYYNKQYDDFEGFHDWAKTTLKQHWNDEREHLYSKEDLESAETHDDLWNAAQTEMATHGKMHGYMRMYWAKKILEWTENPNEALKIGIYLNDKYQLDGRDPNGYTGVAWSIGGVHDRAWTERPIFGKIRYMNYNGCKRKFDVGKYISENVK